MLNHITAAAEKVKARRVEDLKVRPPLPSMTHHSYTSLS